LKLIDQIEHWVLLPQKYGIIFLRISLGAGYLSAVADRLGLWGPPGGPSVSWGNFQNFLAYTAKLAPWCPASLLPALGWFVTIAEVVLGVALVFCLRVRLAGNLSGLLALTFAVSMSIVAGLHPPLIYAVFAVSAASFVLAEAANRSTA
jgi:hypothetical protein